MCVRLSDSIVATIQDDYHKNSILFEAGTHPRELLTTESALMLAEYLIAHASEPRPWLPYAK